jgi:hypothetical protein
LLANKHHLEVKTTSELFYIPTSIRKFKTLSEALDETKQFVTTGCDRTKFAVNTIRIWAGDDEIEVTVDLQYKFPPAAPGWDVRGSCD